jgi:O-antigen ligase
MSIVFALSQDHGATVPKKKPYSGVYLMWLCGTLMFAVLAFGAVETWSTSILEISSALLFTGFVVDHIFHSGRLRWNPLYPPILGFAAVMITQLAFNVTAYRYATLLIFMQYVAYGMLFFVATQITIDECACRSIVLGFCIFGSALALFAVCQNLSSSPNLYWLRPANRDASIFGPYINHNHYAGLMEMLLPLSLVLSLGRLLQRAQRLLLALGAILMAGSIVLSLSRGGTIALIVEILALVWLLRRSSGFNLTPISILLVLAALGFLGLTGSSAMWNHFGHLQDALRLEILKDSMRMFAQRPIAGWGLGAFPTVYPKFRSLYTTFFVNAAHNDYVQALVETGIIGFAFIIWFVAALYRHAWQHTGDWTHHWSGALRTATLTGCTGLLLHSAFDFNLQVPANAALFYVFCAFAIVPPNFSRVAHLTEVRPVGRGRNENFVLVKT